MRPITDVLRDIRRGRAVEQATRMLAELVRAVDELCPGQAPIDAAWEEAKARIA